MLQWNAETGKWLGTCVGLVREGLGETRLQVKLALLLRARGWDARVAREHKRPWTKSEGKGTWRTPHSLSHLTKINTSKNSPSPGVFTADEVAVFPLATFPLSAAGLSGVLEAMQDDIRAGVFTMDLLCSLSQVASEKLESNCNFRHR